MTGLTYIIYIFGKHLYVYMYWKNMLQRMLPCLHGGGGGDVAVGHNIF